ncbi:EF-hand domain-containing protein [Sneathiella aquimaris]|uniref:EF-hand domain-containing protein n=1 Tax=Sneathiella aquimaris TaxID=2599305 RepID=UPI00146E20CC|nr:EF-hand domain-containing protein [Sneathiella aquimaris]
MTKVISIALGCMITLFAAPSLHAAEFNSAQFLGIDRNADNTISPAEAATYRERLFTNLDLDANGSVEFEEYVKANQLRDATAEPGSAVPVPDAYKRNDENGDTVLTLAEFMAAGKAAFKALDTNNDGMISQPEFVAPGL